MDLLFIYLFTDARVRNKDTYLIILFCFFLFVVFFHYIKK
jgi:hypothetical protein